MRVHYGSDLHNEHQIFEFTDENGELLVLAGDVTQIDHLVMREHVAFFEEACERFAHVIYVMGNHEYYFGSFITGINEAKERLKHLNNLHILDNESIAIDGVSFFGGTLWTNLNNEDWFTERKVKDQLNDMRLIHNFEISDWVFDHKWFVNKAREAVLEGSVVISHYLPTFESVPQRFKHMPDLNGGFASDLSQLILDTKPAFWIHGHTHDSCDYMVGDTRVLCNPRGYPFEPRDMPYRLEVFDL